MALNDCACPIIGQVSGSLLKATIVGRAGRDHVYG
jgi:hypothetical protein